MSLYFPKPKRKVNAMNTTYEKMLEWSGFYEADYAEEGTYTLNSRTVTLLSYLFSRFYMTWE